MAHFAEDMKCLRNEIENGRAARNQLVRDLSHFASSLRGDVTKIIDNFSESRTKTAKKIAREQKEFVSNLQQNVRNLQQNVSNFRDDCAREMQEARQGWLGGHGPSSEHRTKKKK